MDLIYPINSPIKIFEDEFLSLPDFYVKGDEVQKICIIQSLPNLLHCDSSGTLTRILPKIQQELPSSSCEFHITTSKVFGTLITEKIYNLNILSTILQGVESKDQIISNAWLETLLIAIPTLNEDIIKTQILPLAMGKSLPNNPVHFRMASCKILGKIAVYPKITSLDVKTNILPLVQSLCQDCFQEVRAVMCSQLHFIAQGLGDNLVKSNLLPNLVELASDENVGVRASAVSAVVLVTPYLTKETKMEIIVPLFKKLCEASMEKDDTTFLTISKEYGKLVNALKEDMESNDKFWFLKFYKTLSNKKPDDYDDSNQAAQCRDNCAFNLPAITQFTVTQIPNKLDSWRVIFSDLANDPCFIVRKSVASCIHEITKVLGPHCKLITSDFVKLLRDDAEEVLQMIVPHLGTTLEVLCKNNVLSKDFTNQSTLEIARAILKCQGQLSMGYNWRTQRDFLEQIEYLVNCTSSDFIHQHFVPVLMNSISETRAKPVKCQLAKTLLMYLRYSTRENQRQWIRENLILNLCYSSSCYTRIIYIDMCYNAITLFSCNYFKKYFFEPLLRLAEDPISNIRLCFTQILPKLIQVFIPVPEDKKLRICLDNAVQKLEITEKDKDVLSVLKVKKREMKETNKRLTTKNEFDKFISKDRKKEEEEQKIIQGKSMTSSPLGYMDMPPRKTTITLNKPLNNRTTVYPRSSQITARRTSSSTSDMRFLEQHFYIDAGITLPNEKLNTVDIGNTSSKLDVSVDIKRSSRREYQQISTVSVENVDVEKMSAIDLKTLEISTTNITDDIKVNLRKIGNLSKIAPKLPNYSRYTASDLKKSKRHSSIFSVSCIEQSSGNLGNNRKTLHRRSLNIVGDASKIPVCLKSKSISENMNNRNDKKDLIRNKEESNGAETNLIGNNKGKEVLPNNSIKNITRENSPKLSGLPVLKRRTNFTRK